MKEVIEEVVVDFAVKYELEDEDMVELCDNLVDAIEGYFEYRSYSVAPPTDNPEIEKLKRELEAERSKIPCPECKGSGDIVTYGGSLVHTASCQKCSGSGRVLRKEKVL